MQIFNKISLQLQNIYKVKSGRRYLYHNREYRKITRYFIPNKFGKTVLGSSIIYSLIGSVKRLFWEERQQLVYVSEKHF
jgi:hypothetical protein